MALDLSKDKTQSLYDRGYLSDNAYNQLIGVPDVAPLSLAPNYTPEPDAQPLSWWDRTKASLANTSMPDLRVKGVGPSDLAPSTPEPVADTPAPSSLAIDNQVAASPVASVASPYDAAYAGQQKAVTDVGNAQAARFDAQSTDFNNYLAKSQAMEIEQNKKETERQLKEQTAYDALDKSTNEVMGMKIDPDHFWASKSTGNKIGLGIALALGAIGGANDGNNKVSKIITDAIDRDLKTQQMNIGNKQAGVNAKGSLLNHMRANFKDDRAAEDASKVAALQRVEMQIKQKAAQYSSPEAKANASKLLNEIELEKKKAQQAFIQSAGTGMPVGLTNSEKMSFQKDIRERTVPGLGLIDDGREAPKVRDMKANFDGLRANIVEMAKLQKEHGHVANPFNPAVAKGKALAADTLIKMKELANLGALTKPDMELMDPLVPSDPTAFFSKDMDGKLDNLKKITERSYLKFIGARGLKDPSLADKPRGN